MEEILSLCACSAAPQKVLRGPRTAHVRLLPLRSRPAQMVRTELDRIRLAEEAARLRAQLAEARAADANARAITEAHRAEQRVRDVMATMASERDAAVSLRGWGEGQCWVGHPLDCPADYDASLSTVLCL
jgi:hypothetical protein